MSTHPHLVCRSTQGQPAFSAFWKVVNQCFARWSNRRTGGRGQVVMERLGSPRIQAGGRHELEVMLYGDLNPVRAGMVKRPRDWAWSSHGHYAFGAYDPLVSDSPAYLALGRSPGERRTPTFACSRSGLPSVCAATDPTWFDAPSSDSPTGSRPHLRNWRGFPADDVSRQTRPRSRNHLTESRIPSTKETRGAHPSSRLALSEEHVHAGSRISIILSRERMAGRPVRRAAADDAPAASQVMTSGMGTTAPRRAQCGQRAASECLPGVVHAVCAEVDPGCTGDIDPRSSLGHVDDHRDQIVHVDEAVVLLPHP